MHTEQAIGSETFVKAVNEATKIMSESDVSIQNSCFASCPSEKDFNDADINDTRDNVSSSSEFEREATGPAVKSEEWHKVGEDIQNLPKYQNEAIDITSNVTSNVTGNDIINPAMIKTSEGETIAQEGVMSEDDVSKQSSSSMPDSNVFVMPAQYTENVNDIGSDKIESLPKDKKDIGSGKIESSSIKTVWDLNDTSYCESKEGRDTSQLRKQIDEKQNLLTPSTFSKLSINTRCDKQEEQFAPRDTFPSAHTEENVSQLKFSSSLQKPKSSLAVAAMQGTKVMNIDNPPPGFVSPISVLASNRGTTVDKMDTSFSSARSEGCRQQRVKVGKQGRQNPLLNRTAPTFRNDNVGTQQRSSTHDHNSSGITSIDHVDHEYRYGTGGTIRRGFLPSVITASSANTGSSSVSSYQVSRQSQKYNKQPWSRHKFEDRKRGENNNPQVKGSSLRHVESYVLPGCNTIDNEKISRDVGQYSTQSTGALEKMLPEINTNVLSSSVQIPPLQDFGSGECIRMSSSSSIYSDCQSFTSTSGKRPTSFDESYPSKQSVLRKQESNNSEEHCVRVYLFEEDVEDTFDEGSILPAEKETSFVPITPDSSPRTRKREWRLKMNRKLANIAVGDLDPSDVPIIVLMNVGEGPKFFLIIYIISNICFCIYKLQGMGEDKVKQRCSNG